MEEQRLTYLNLVNALQGDRFLGLDAADERRPRAYPMVNALVASSEARRYRATGDRDALERAIDRADWLVRYRDRDGDGIPGWGLPVAWDAGSNGSVNPAHTEYAITTALALKALMDVSTVLEGDGENDNKRRHQRYMNVAAEAAEAWVHGGFYTQLEDGTAFLWYSHRPVDAYPVINVNSMLGGEFFRLSQRLGDSDSAIRGLALNVMAYLGRSMQPSDGAARWSYLGDPTSAGRESRENDILHAAYTVDGILVFQSCGGTGAAAMPMSSLLDGLNGFWHDSAFHEFQGRPQPGARSWGIGYFLHVVASANFDPDLQARAFSELVNLKQENRYVPHRSGDSRTFIRDQAHILLGLATYAYGDIAPCEGG